MRPVVVIRPTESAKTRIGVFPLGQIWRVCSNKGIEHAHSSQAAALADANCQAVRLVGEGMAVELFVHETFRLWPRVLEGQQETATSRLTGLPRHNAFAAGKPNGDFPALR